MSELWLVRHGRPLIDPSRPAAEWVLADPDDPPLCALRDAGVLPSAARWVTSPEPKAYATAVTLRGGPIETCAGLVEQRRSSEWVDDPAEWAATVRRAVQEPQRPALRGWEPAADTRTRVTAAVRTLLHRTDRDLVLIGHGTAWTLLVAELTGADPDLAAWADMRMPDVCALAISEAGIALLRAWGSLGPAA